MGFTILPHEPTLGEIMGSSFGGGFQKGIEGILEKRLKNQGITPYQELLSKERSSESNRKQQQNLMTTFFKLAENNPQFMNMSQDDMLGILNKASQSLSSGKSIPQALQEALPGFKMPETEPQLAEQPQPAQPPVQQKKQVETPKTKGKKELKPLSSDEIRKIIAKQPGKDPKQKLNNAAKYLRSLGYDVNL